MIDQLNQYDSVVQDLDREVRALEARAAKLRRVINDLREIAREARTEARAQRAIPSPQAQLDLEENGDSPTPKYQRGDTTKLVLKTIAENKGITSTALGDKLKDQVNSAAKHPRRLIINAVGYLYSKGRVRKDASGGWIIAGS